MQTTTLTVAQYYQVLDRHLPRFSAEDQRAALILYRELARGQPVDAAQLGRALGATAAEAEAVLHGPIKAFVYPDDRGRVAGFGGLATAPMHHRLEVDGRTLWTWCAWDSLFLPELLGKRARVVSPDPETGEPVELVVAPHRIESARPAEAVVSFLLPDAGDFDTSAANVMATFCHFVFFFSSRGAGERWAARHPGTFLLPLEDAFTLARRANRRTFGEALDRRADAA